MDTDATGPGSATREHTDGAPTALSGTVRIGADEGV